MISLKLSERDLYTQVDDNAPNWVFDTQWCLNKIHAWHHLKGYLHNLLLPNNNPTLEVDHKDRNPLNNQIDNLRWVTKSQNRVNIGLRKDNVSGYKGVHFVWSHRNGGRFKVLCSKDGISHKGGFFADIHEAAKAYNDLSKKLHGEFAYQNEIQNAQ